MQWGARQLHRSIVAQLRRRFGRFRLCMQKGAWKMGRQVIKKRKMPSDLDVSLLQTISRDVKIPEARERTTEIRRVFDRFMHLQSEPVDLVSIDKPVIIESTTSLTPEGGDVYFDRLMKLIPAEIVALFLFIQGILRSALGSEGQEVHLQGWMWATFVVISILNVLYLKHIQFVSDKKQLAFLTLAFIVWVFSLGGPFEFFSFYQPFMGSVILALYTFTVPMIYKGIDIS